MFRRHLFLVSTFLCSALATPALAQTRDHLACYKVKADKAFASATVDLLALQAEYNLQGCSLKPKAKLICIPVQKLVTNLTEGTPLEINGETDATQSICYSVKCPEGTAPDGTFSDQFGTHLLTKFKPSILCAPAVVGVPEPCVATPEVCNGIDDDCNGEIDDTLGQTSCGTGACASTVDNCAGGSPQVCTPGVPSGEVCNLVDDDCDGQTDEDLGQTQCGVGACSRNVNNCDNGVEQICTPGSPSAEECGNGIDDDCDGTVDEGC